MDAGGFLDFLIHFDEHLGGFIRRFGGWTYFALFGLILVETGGVVTMVLPGDEVIFVAAALAVRYQALDMRLLMPVLILAAFCGDQISYLLGRKLGRKAFRRNARLFNVRHLRRAETFYRRHGARAVLFGRFVPVVRGLMPFTAAVASMPYPRFLGYSLVGATLWTAAYGYSGYFFGRLPFVREHFVLVLIGVAAVSLLPVALHFWIHHWRQRSRKRRTSPRKAPSGKAPGHGESLPPRKRGKKG